jgi:hypothetical protein
MMSPSLGVGCRAPVGDRVQLACGLDLDLGYTYPGGMR